jgi:hypothetical protein
MRQFPGDKAKSIPSQHRAKSFQFKLILKPAHSDGYRRYAAFGA